MIYFTVNVFTYWESLHEHVGKKQPSGVPDLGIFPDMVIDFKGRLNGIPVYTTPNLEKGIIKLCELSE